MWLPSEVPCSSDDVVGVRLRSHGFVKGERQQIPVNAHPVESERDKKRSRTLIGTSSGSSCADDFASASQTMQNASPDGLMKFLMIKNLKNENQPADESITGKVRRGNR